MGEPLRLERTVPGIGTIEFVETDKTRAYWFLAEGGTRRQRFPSVTGILRATWPKPALLEWYAKHGRETDTLLEEASKRGKAIHAFVENYMRSGELERMTAYPSEYAGYLSGIARFLWEHDPQPLVIEQLIVHPEMRYAGRLDLIATMGGKRTLLDFKTNTKGRVYTEAHVQATAYAIADERCGGDKIEDVAIVGVADDGNYDLVRGADATALWASALDFYGHVRRFERQVQSESAQGAPT